MIATARRLLHDRRLLYRALRIGLLVSLGWWLWPKPVSRRS